MTHLETKSTFKQTVEEEYNRLCEKHSIPKSISDAQLSNLIDQIKEVIFRLKSFKVDNLNISDKAADLYIMQACRKVLKEYL